MKTLIKIVHKIWYCLTWPDHTKFHSKIDYGEENIHKAHEKKLFSPHEEQ